jgi:hypothetical protein
MGDTKISHIENGTVTLILTSMKPHETNEIAQHSNIQWIYQTAIQGTIQLSTKSQREKRKAGRAAVPREGPVVQLRGAAVPGRKNA